MTNPVTTVNTIGKGQSSSNNLKVLHAITGNIVDPTSLGPTANRIPLCAGTEVSIVVSDTTGVPVTTAGGSLSGNGSTLLSGFVNATEKYRSVSADGTDVDRMTLLPR